MKKCHLTDSIDPGNSKTIEQLWESVRLFAVNRCNANQGYDGMYPLEIRIVQMSSFYKLIKEINKFHKKFNNSRL